MTPSGAATTADDVRREQQGLVPTPATPEVDANFAETNGGVKEEPTLEPQVDLPAEEPVQKESVPETSEPSIEVAPEVPETGPGTVTPETPAEGAPV